MTEETQATTHFCPHCGFDHPVGQSVCPKCRKHREREDDPGDAVEPEEDGPAEEPDAETLCTCGHGRDAHEDGTGKCRFVDHNTSVQGDQTIDSEDPCLCEAFVEACPAAEETEEADGPDGECDIVQDPPPGSTAALQAKQSGIRHILDTTRKMLEEEQKKRSKADDRCKAHEDHIESLEIRGADYATLLGIAQDDETRKKNGQLGIFDDDANSDLVKQLEAKIDGAGPQELADILNEIERGIVKLNLPEFEIECPLVLPADPDDDKADTSHCVRFADVEPDTWCDFELGITEAGADHNDIDTTTELIRLGGHVLSMIHEPEAPESTEDSPA